VAYNLIGTKHAVEFRLRDIQDLVTMGNVQDMFGAGRLASSAAILVLPLPGGSTTEASCLAQFVSVAQFSQRFVLEYVQDSMCWRIATFCNGRLLFDERLLRTRIRTRQEDVQSPPRLRRVDRNPSGRLSNRIVPLLHQG
jgi:hypothetical protein